MSTRSCECDGRSYCSVFPLHLILIFHKLLFPMYNHRPFFLSLPPMSCPPHPLKSFLLISLHPSSSFSYRRPSDRFPWRVAARWPRGICQGCSCPPRAVANGYHIQGCSPVAPGNQGSHSRPEEDLSVRQPQLQQTFQPGELGRWVCVLNFLYKMFISGLWRLWLMEADTSLYLLLIFISDLGKHLLTPVHCILTMSIIVWVRKKPCIVFPCALWPIWVDQWRQTRPLKMGSTDENRILIISLKQELNSTQLLFTVCQLLYH